MVAKLTIAALALVVGLAAGYALGGNGWAGLAYLTGSGATAQAEAAATQPEPGESRLGVDEAVAKALLNLSDRLREQNVELRAQRAELAKLSAGSANRKDLLAAEQALGACGASRATVQRDLEQCLFSKAELSRARPDAQSAAPAPSSGRSPVETTVSYPIPAKRP